jgi:glycosyltransferase involved in cell wall biosynthesis
LSSRKSRRTLAIYNLFWDTYGGGEVVAGELARVMSASHEVTLLGPNRPDADEFKDRLGVDISEFAWREVSDDVEASHASGEYDLFINCTYSSRVVNRAAIGLYYVHFPRKLVPRTKKVALENSLRLVRLAAKTPFKTSKLQTAERVFRESLIDDSWVSSYTTFIANSRYTERWIDKIWNRDSVIIHPPVHSHVSESEKSHLIACVGRFFDPIHGHSKKQLELLTAFADMARSHLGVDDWRLTLIGGADARSRDYVMRIRRAAVELPVEVHVNVDKEVVDRTLAGASIYWHATGYDEDELAHPDRLEHFGISVVEAMAAGAVPLVFGAGGPAEIVRHGVDGFHWHTLEQLAQLTRRLMGDSELRSSMSSAARERARDFAPEVFDRSVRDLVESLKVGSQTR